MEEAEYASYYANIAYSTLAKANEGYNKARDAYASLNKAAAAAADRVTNAQNQLNILLNAIKNVQANATLDKAALNARLADLRRAVATAKENVENAKVNLKETNQQLETAKVTLTKKTQDLNEAKRLQEEAAKRAEEAAKQNEGANSQNETDSEAFTEGEGSSVITAVVTNEVAAPASADGAVTVSSLVAADGAQVLGAKRVATTSDTAKTTTKVATDTKKEANKTSDNKASKSENKAVETNEAVTDNTASESDKEAVVAESEPKNTEENTAQGEAVTIVDEESAKAADPAEKQASFPWWIVAILAAAAGISVEEYARRKNIKVKSNNKDSFNK